jgi:glucose 1-dehydrogenase
VHARSDDRPPHRRLAGGHLRPYTQAAQALLDANLGWLGGLVSRRVPLADFAEAFEARDDDVKVVITLEH